MSENVEVQESEAQPSRRGRPRPQDVLQRDDRTLELLREGPKTRNELAEALGVKPDTAYLSLYRLRRAGQVEKIHGEGAEGVEDAKGRGFKWQIVATA